MKKESKSKTKGKKKVALKDLKARQEESVKGGRLKRCPSDPS